MTIRITAPSFSAASSKGGSSSLEIKSEPKKSVLKRRIAIFVSLIALLISYFHFCPG